MNVRRVALVLFVGAATLVPLVSSADTTSPTGLPLFQFVNSGVGPLPWNAVALAPVLGSVTMAGNPHAASGPSGGAVAFRTNTGDVGLLTQPTSGTPTYQDLTVTDHLPATSSDPVPFFDPSGNLDLLVVTSSNHLLLVSPNTNATPNWTRFHRGQAWTPLALTDLSALTGVTASAGLPSIAVTGSSALVAYRSASGGLEALALTWSSPDPLPIFSGQASLISGAQVTTTSTSIPSAAANITSDPVVIAGTIPQVAAIASSGDLLVFEGAAGLTSWTSLDVTTLTQGPKVAGAIATTVDGANVDLAALTPSGAPALYVTAYATSSARLSQVNPGGWSALAPSVPNGPPLAGQLALSALNGTISIAGQAANWGDLFVDTGSLAGAWSATDVSTTAGSNARSVGPAVAAVVSSNTVTLYAGGVDSPPKQGVGVYAIPATKWAQAVSDGWPIISETGGLGTKSAPWVGFETATSVATSPDFLLGQAIYNAHQRVTWLSFWTASGPLANETRTPTTYYNHGFAAGAWVATQIDQYRSLGVGLKPDWVIFDPEGWPDNHSGLDAPSGSNPATLALYATYWTGMLSGWQAGLASVDPSLHAGVYASQSEYRNYQLATTSLPIFEAVAFGNGGPLPIAGASGSNIRGYIAFSAKCAPTSTLLQEEQTLLSPPWSGQFNTLQFNQGVYCPPAH